MRKIFIVVLIVVIGLSFVLFSTNKTDANEEYLRIHIRANSNLDIDQNVKYKIKDKVVEYLIPVLCECETKEQAEKALKQNFDGIENVANEILRQNGFSYSSHAKLCNEYFPTRSYQDLTLDEGFYDWNLGKQREIIGGALSIRHYVLCQQTRPEKELCINPKFCT